MFRSATRGSTRKAITVRGKRLQPHRCLNVRKPTNLISVPAYSFTLARPLVHEVNSRKLLTPVQQHRRHYASKSKAKKKQQAEQPTPKSKYHESDILRASAIVPDMSLEMTTKYKAFWDFLVENFERLEEGLQVNEKSEQIFDEITLQLHKVTDELGAMILPNSDSNPNTKELVISADRRITAFPIVLGMVATAPKHFFRSKGWAITAFKPRMYPDEKDCVELESIKFYFHEILMSISKTLTRSHPSAAEQIQRESMEGGSFFNPRFSQPGQNQEKPLYQPVLHQHLVNELEKKQQVRLIVCLKGGTVRVSTEIEYVVLGMIESVIGEYDMAMHVQEVDFVKDFVTKARAEKTSEEEEEYEREQQQELGNVDEGISELFGGSQQRQQEKEAEEYERRQKEVEFYKKLEESALAGKIKEEMLPFQLTDLAQKFDELLKRAPPKDVDRDL